MTIEQNHMPSFSPDHPGARWAFLSQAQRDAAYNNAAHVPNSAELVAARNAASSAYRAAQPRMRDVAYGARPRERWDLYPSDNPKAPCLVFIHGGYWQMNSRENFACFVEGLATHGWSVALPGYTLAPEASVREIVHEIFSALDWLKEHCGRVGIGTDVVVAGWSAGAQLATLALNHPIAKAGVAISGVYELAPLRDTYLNEKLRLDDAEIETFSPCRTPVTEKPLIVAYGTAELPALVEDSRALHARRASAHAPGALLPVPHADHYSVLEQLRSRDGVLTRACLDLAKSL
jgi:arylformamidase